MFHKNHKKSITGLLCALLTVAVFLLIDQINLLFQIMYIYFALCAFLWGILFIFVGAKQLRQERRNGKSLRWNQNPYIIIGVIITLPSFFGLITHKWSIDLIGHTGVLFVDIIEIVVVSVFLVFWLFFEVVLTVGFISTLLNRTDLSRQFLRDTVSEAGGSEQSSEENL